MSNKLVKKLQKYQKYLIENSSSYKEWREEKIKQLTKINELADVETDMDKLKELNDEFDKVMATKYRLDEAIDVDAPNHEYIYKQILRLEKRLETA